MASRSWGFARGGTGAISVAIARVAEHFGAEVRTNAGVDHIKVVRGEAKGVAEDGTEIDLTSSSVEPNPGSRSWAWWERKNSRLTL